MSDNKNTQESAPSLESTIRRAGSLFADQLRGDPPAWRSVVIYPKNKDPDSCMICALAYAARSLGLVEMEYPIGDDDYVLVRAVGCKGEDTETLATSAEADWLRRLVDIAKHIHHIQL